MKKPKKEIVKRGRPKGSGKVTTVPSWENMLPTLITFLCTDSAENKELAKQELKRMAKAADLYNQKWKK